METIGIGFEDRRVLRKIRVNERGAVITRGNETYKEAKNTEKSGSTSGCVINRRQYILI